MDSQAVAIGQSSTAPTDKSRRHVQLCVEDVQHVSAKTTTADDTTLGNIGTTILAVLNAHTLELLFKKAVTCTKRNSLSLLMATMCTLTVTVRRGNGRVHVITSVDFRVKPAPTGNAYHLP